MFDRPAFVHYTHQYRHWHLPSEPYTGVDSLMSVLKDGWQIVGQAYCEHFPLFSTRTVAIYHLYLLREGTIQRMCVIDSPYLQHILSQKGIAIHEFGQDKTYARSMNELELNKAKIA